MVDIKYTDEQIQDDITEYKQLEVVDQEARKKELKIKSIELRIRKLAKKTGMSVQQIISMLEE